MTATVLLTITCPGIGLVVGYYCLTERYFDWRSAAFCIALFMASVAYSYNPTEPTDIVRYIEFAQNISRMPLGEALNTSIHKSENLWVFSLACWILGKTGLFHLIPAVSVFLVYYLSLYMLGRYGEDSNADRNEITAFMFFTVLAISLFSIVNNVRNVLSFVLVGFGIFRDIYEEKRDIGTLLLYVLPLFIHPSSLVVILCRLIVPFVSKFQVIGIVLCLMIKPIVDELHSLTSGMASGTFAAQVIKEPVNKAYIYFHDDHSAWGLVASNSTSIRAAKMLHIILLLIILFFGYRYTSFLYKKIKQHEDVKRSRKLILMTNLCFVIGLMGLASTPMLTPSYWRFAAAAFFLASPIYISIDLVKRGEPDADGFIVIVCDLLKKLMFVCMILCCLLWMRDFRNSELGKLFLQPFATSPVALFFRFIFEKISFYL